MTLQDGNNIVMSRLLAGTQYNTGLPVLLASFVTAQAGHESDGYTSDVYNNALNAFGYDYTPQSVYQVGNYNGYGVYQSLDDSAAELVDYLNRRVRDGSFPALDTITTPDQYAGLLKAAGYYGDSLSNYTAGIKRWLAQVTTSPGGMAGGGLLLVAIAVLIIYKLSK